MTTTQSQWSLALKDRPFLNQIGYTLLLLIGCAFIAPYLFDYIEKRKGVVLSDPVLDILPTVDVSIPIFALLYLLIGAGIYQLLKSPTKLLLGLRAYLFITMMRFTTLLLVPLDPPPGIWELHDPFVQFLFYQQSVTKDLFFSGHTGIMALFFFLFGKLTAWGKIFAGGTVLIGVFLLVQHAHYTIDVVAAPGFAWMAYRLGGFSEKVGTPNF